MTKPVLADNIDGRPTRKRRWPRRVLIATVVLVLLVIVGAVLVVKLEPVPAPLALPAATATPAGSIQGTWQVGAGSVAGFRIQETVLFVSNDVVERTNAVQGSLVIDGTTIRTATFQVDLTTITSHGKTQPQLAVSLDTSSHPDATLVLTRPITLSPAVTSGATVTAVASGQLTLRGVTRPITFTITGHQDGTALQAVGSIPVVFADWGIQGPRGYGPLGSLADHGVIEFLVVLSHR